MGFKEWPGWLRGMVLGFFIGFLINLLALAESQSNPWNWAQFTFNIPALIILYPFLAPLDYFFPKFYEIYFTTDIGILLIGSLGYGLIGMVGCWIIGKIKSRKESAPSG